MITNCIFNGPLIPTLEYHMHLIGDDALEET